VVWIQSLAWELPYNVSVAIKKKERKKDNNNKQAKYHERYLLLYLLRLPKFIPPSFPLLSVSSRAFPSFPSFSTYLLFSFSL